MGLGVLRPGVVRYRGGLSGVINCTAARAPRRDCKNERSCFPEGNLLEQVVFSLPAAGLLVRDRRGLPARNDGMQQLAGGENRRPATLSQL